MNNQLHRKKIVRNMILIIAILPILATLQLWGWNTFAVEVFGMVQIKFKHVMAAQALVVSTILFMQIIFSFFSSRLHRHEVQQ
jgi:uncharacterized membrane protein